MADQTQSHSADLDSDGDRDRTTSEHYNLCCEDAERLFGALQRGHDYYRSKVKVHQRDDDETSAGRLLAVTGAMLASREATTEMIAVILFSARGVDEYPSKLRAFFDDFIRHPGLDLPKVLARSCRVQPAWFSRWARDYHQAGGVDIRWADDQVIRTGLSALVDNYLASLSSVNEVIELLERGVMHFFKSVVNAQKDQPTVDPQVIAATVAAPDDGSSDLPINPVQVTGELWYRLEQTFRDSNPVWRPAHAWLTAALIDIGSNPLPAPAQAALSGCPSAARELKLYWGRFVDVPTDPVNHAGLPRDSRARLRIAFAVLEDLLALGAPVRLHDSNYQKHKRAVRLVNKALHLYRNEIALREPADPERQRGDA